MVISGSGVELNFVISMVSLVTNKIEVWAIFSVFEFLKADKPQKLLIWTDHKSKFKILNFASWKKTKWTPVSNRKFLVLRIPYQNFSSIQYGIRIRNFFRTLSGSYWNKGRKNPFWIRNHNWKNILLRWHNVCLTYSTVILKLNDKPIVFWCLRCI